MNLLNQTGLAKVDEAIQLFYAKLPPIYQALKELPQGSRDFTYTDFSNNYVGYSLESHFQSSVTLKIVVKKTKWPWSAAVGWTNGSDILYINGWKINSLTKEALAGLFGHEFCHFPCGFKHGGDKIDSFKILSVPYSIGYLISGEGKHPLGKYRSHVID